jgi:hypothetical protein
MRAMYPGRRSASGREDPLQRDVEVEGQVRLQVVMGLIPAGGCECLRRERDVRAAGDVGETIARPRKSACRSWRLKFTRVGRYLRLMRVGRNLGFEQ